MRKEAPLRLLGLGTLVVGGAIALGTAAATYTQAGVTSFYGNAVTSDAELPSRALDPADATPAPEPVVYAPVGPSSPEPRVLAESSPLMPPDEVADDAGRHVRPVRLVRRADESSDAASTTLDVVRHGVAVQDGPVGDSDAGDPRPAEPEGAPSEEPLP